MNYDPWDDLIDGLIGGGTLGEFLKSTPGRMAVGAAVGKFTWGLFQPVGSAAGRMGVTFRCHDCETEERVRYVREFHDAANEHHGHHVEVGASSEIRV